MMSSFDRVVESGPQLTTLCLVDQTKFELAHVHLSVEEQQQQQNQLLDSRKYYTQAYGMLWVGAAKPVPPFIVYLSDLSPRLIKELHSLNVSDRHFVLKQAVGRIFEDINPELYHNSISRVLWVKPQ